MESEKTGAVARTIVLAGFSILGLMAVSTLAVILWLYGTGKEVPQGLALIFTATGGAAVTTFGGIVKDYLARPIVKAD